MTSAVAISGSPSRQSRSRRLLVHATARLDRAGWATSIVDLCDLPADDLLGRTRSSAMAEALAAVAAARIVIVGTPVYRATYSGLLKVFFDLFAPDALARAAAVPVATGGSPAHQLVVDHALRPLLASVGAVVVAAGVYGIDAQFTQTTVDSGLTQRVDEAIDVAIRLAHAIQE